MPFGVIWASHGGREGAKMDSHAGESVFWWGGPSMIINGRRFKIPSKWVLK